MGIRVKSIQYSSEDSHGLFDDEVVELSDETFLDLVSALYQALPFPTSSQMIRRVPEPTPTGVDPRSHYEIDYQKASAKLHAVSWRDLGVQGAVYLSAYRGCLSQEEHRNLVPFFLEILLRAGRYSNSLGYLLFFLDRRSHPQELQALYDVPKTRRLIFDALASIQKKFPETSRLAERLLVGWQATG